MPQEVPKNKPETQAEAHERAVVSAKGALQQYELRNIGGQLRGASNLGVKRETVQDVLNRQFVLSNAVRDNASTTEIAAMTKGLKESMDTFTAAVEKAEASNPEVKEKRGAVESSAKGALQQYELRNIGDQIKSATDLGVKDEVTQDVRFRQFMLENKVRDKASVTELEAMTKGLKESMDKFTKAVEKAEEEKKEKSDLEKMEDSFK